MDSMERTPLYRVEDGVAWITMNRPETLNSFTQDFVLEINDAITRADSDSNVRVLVITGEGRGFTSGGTAFVPFTMSTPRRIWYACCIM